MYFMKIGLKTMQALGKITHTNSCVNQGPKNEHHCLPTQSGGSNEEQNRADVNKDWHTCYNLLPLAQNGCAQPTRFAAQLLINSSSQNGVIEPAVARRILHVLTPRHWQDSYETEVVSESARDFNYKITPGNNQIHLISRNISQSILAESSQVREAVYNLQTRYENGQSHTLAQVFKFFECNRVDKALLKYMYSEPLTQAIKLETRYEIINLLKNGLTSRSRQVRSEYIEIYEEHFKMLQFADNWWPVRQQFALAQDGINNISLREQTRREKRRNRNRKN